ncbi:MAG: trypsin-like peptidase domain-containing protein [Lachnospiraceae bacterium]|nr:trypsin-like peptidase domain-containing protein [Lachnospiraceae bacterium]
MYNNESYEDNEVVVECKVADIPEVTPKKSGTRKKVTKAVAGVMCAALLACGGYAVGATFGGFGSRSEAKEQLIPETGKSDTDIPNATAASTIALNNANDAANKKSYTVAEIAANCMSSVVAITAKSTEEVYTMFGQAQQYESEGAGSGIIIAKTEEELIIATNNHVVEGATDLTVCFNDSEEQIYESYIKGLDPSSDLAVVAVALEDIPAEVLKTLTVARLGDSDKCVIGEQVVAIGNALGYGQSLTSGYVSALNREVTVDEVTYQLIQTDAAINPGNSGGALFNMYGEVIGINSVKLAANEVEGIGYAIPISDAVPILTMLAEREAREAVAEEEQGYLGISGSDVGSTMASGYNMPVGVYVSEVTEDSAAEKAGVVKGDIITAFDKMNVSTMTQLKGYLQYYKAGETVELTVKRLEDGEYKEYTLEITLQEKPESMKASAEQEENNSNERNENNYGGGYDRGYGNSYGYGFDSDMQDFFRYFFGR